MKLDDSQAPEDEVKTCPRCGFIWKNFKQTRELGCPQCYETFHQDVVHWLTKKGYGYEYTGSGPRKDAEAARRDERKNELENALAWSLRQELYEEAARIRDELRSLQEGK